MRRLRLTLFLLFLGALAAFVLFEFRLREESPSLARLTSDLNAAAAAASSAAEEERAARVRLDSAVEELQFRIRTSSLGVDAAQENVAILRQELDRARVRVGAAADSRSAAEVAIEKSRSLSESHSQTRIFYLVGLALLLAAMLAAYRYYRAEREREYENRKIIERHASVAVPVSAEGQLGFDELWNQNQSRLRDYHQLVVNYATSTRQSTIAILIAGFVLIVVMGLVAFLAETVASAIASSVVATAAAAVTAFTAQAVLRNSDTSSREVLNFFAHPLYMERMLIAERMIGSLQPEAKDAAKMELVRQLVVFAEASGRSVPTSTSEAEVSNGQP